MSAKVKVAIGFIALLPAGGIQAAAPVRHELTVTLEPEQHGIAVIDMVTLPEPLGRDQSLQFTLHPDLTVDAAPHRLRCSRPESDSSPAGLMPQTCTLTAGEPVSTLTLRYSGTIQHALRQQGDDTRGFQETPGFIGAEGVFLTGASQWYPQFGGEFVNFTLEVTLPESWRAVSQGSRRLDTVTGRQRRNRWEEQSPQEEIFLVAGPFTEYSEPDSTGPITAYAYLRTADPALARRYLDATGPVIESYQRLIGPYPYGKFALVENFWETGYGMPSFTLLGAKVIRLPFILYSSYPHEILHNWWGNGVYVDYANGNWSEGLTSYLADHLLKEQQGEGAAWRRDLLQNYTDFVGVGKDFPLAQFHGRHSASTEAVGYGKAQMVFHLLRQELGDNAFIQGLRQFYRKYRFQRAGFAELFTEFAAAGQRDLGRFAAQWIQRPGAPELRLDAVQVAQTGDAYTITGTIEQLQEGAPFELHLPVAITLQGMEAAYQTHIEMMRKRQDFSLTVPKPPLRLDVDPEFDVFRRLHPTELPAALSLAFGAERSLIVIPARAPPSLRESYEALATRWQNQGSAITVVPDDAIEDLPADGAVWLLGWENRFLDRFKENSRDEDLSWTPSAVVLNRTAYEADRATVVLATRRRGNPRQALIWLGASQAAAVAGLAAKLPHYRKYSYLVFTGAEPTVIAKGQWPVHGSPLSVIFPSGTGSQIPPPARLAVRRPLIELPLP